MKQEGKKAFEYFVGSAGREFSEFLSTQKAEDY